PLADTLGPTLCMAHAPDGTTLAAGTGDGSITTWELATGKAASLKGHTDEVLALAYAPDGQTLASASRDATAKLWNLVTGKEAIALQGHTDAVWSVAFAADGRAVATGSADHTVKFWDHDHGSLLESLAEQALVLAFRQANDGTLVIMPNADQTVTLRQ